MKGWCSSTSGRDVQVIVRVVDEEKERIDKGLRIWPHIHPPTKTHTPILCTSPSFALLSFFFFLSFLLSFTSGCTASSSCNTKRIKLHHQPSSTSFLLPHCSPSLLKNHHPLTLNNPYQPRSHRFFISQPLQLPPPLHTLTAPSYKVTLTPSLPFSFLFL